MSDEEKQGEEAAAVTPSRKGASRGGRARAAVLSPEKRREIASTAARARWQNRDGVATATHLGTLEILPGVQLPCAVLEDGTRVLSQRGFYGGFGEGNPSRSRSADSDFELPAFLTAKNLKPFISDELATALKTPLLYQTISGNRGGGNLSYGIRADLFPTICGVWLDARDAGMLHHTQADIAQRAYMFTRALAKVGILALVDEATGYQYDRARDELQQILAAYIAEELRPWVSAFPHEFFRQVYRLHGWEYKAGSTKRPGYVGQIINKAIYEKLPPPVLPELRRINPSRRGQRKHKHFQFLTDDTGIPHLDQQISHVTTLMRASRNKGEFWRLLERAFPNSQQQQDLPIDTGEEDDH